MEVEAILKDAAALARKHGAKQVETATIRAREAAGGVVRFAEANGFDPIVIGTGDRLGISRLVLGSVAAEVAGGALLCDGEAVGCTRAIKGNVLKYNIIIWDVRSC